MSQPLVSVIVPTYNSELYLAEAIASVEAQDHRPLEVIVVDGGSHDRTVEIARSFPSVRCLHEEQGGAAGARTAGLDVARGDFLTFLDADDVLLAHKLSAQVAFLSDNPAVGCVIVRGRPFLQEGTPAPSWLAREEAAGNAGAVYFISAMVRREVVQQVGGFDPAYRLTDDTDWLYRLRSADIQIAVLDRVLMLRRVHDANLSHQVTAMAAERMRVLKARIDRDRLTRAERHTAR
jgi:glycosyltransferase involved in cell wall biosynthesis